MNDKRIIELHKVFLKDVVNNAIIKDCLNSAVHISFKIIYKKRMYFVYPRNDYHSDSPNIFVETKRITKGHISLGYLLSSQADILSYVFIKGYTFVRGYLIDMKKLKNWWKNVKEGTYRQFKWTKNSQTTFGCAVPLEDIKDFIIYPKSEGVEVYG